MHATGKRDVTKDAQGPDSAGESEFPGWNGFAGCLNKSPIVTVALTVPTRIACLVLGVAVLGGLLMLWGGRSDGPYEPLFDGRTFSPRELAKMTAAFQTAGLKGARLADNQILVPKANMDAYLVALDAADALPADFDDSLDELAADSNPFASRQQTEMGFRLAEQKKLARILSGMNGIDTASVQYAEIKKPGFPPTCDIRAVVAVRADGKRHLAYRRNRSHSRHRRRLRGGLGPGPGDGFRPERLPRLSGRRRCGRPRRRELRRPCRTGQAGRGIPHQDSKPLGGLSGRHCRRERASGRGLGDHFVGRGPGRRPPPFHARAGVSLDRSAEKLLRSGLARAKHGHRTGRLPTGEHCRPSNRKSSRRSSKPCWRCCRRRPPRCDDPRRSW